MPLSANCTRWRLYSSTFPILCHNDPRTRGLPELGTCGVSNALSVTLPGRRAKWADLSESCSHGSCHSGACVQPARKSAIAICRRVTRDRHAKTRLFAFAKGK